MTAQSLREPETVQVIRARLDMRHPFEPPEGAATVVLRNALDGSTPRLSTECSLFHDETGLYLLFAGADEGVVATMRRRDEPLWQEDVVEVFLAPNDPRQYVELEVNPLGTLFDAKIDSPDGDRRTMKADLEWCCTGFRATVRRERDPASKTLKVLVFVPFSGLGRIPPAPGEEWWANLFRIDRAPQGDEFSAWQPTFRNPPDFHVPDAFGRLRFQG